MLFIETSREQLGLVPFLVIPEISSDLPTFLLVAHEPTALPLVAELEPYVGRIVFEAPRVNNIGQFASSILGIPHRSKYIDLVWAKTHPWRESLCRVFSTEEQLAQLNASARIDIRFSKKTGGSLEGFFDSQALLLQGMAEQSACVATRFHR